MPDYKKLYFSLFNAITDEIENLKKIQIDAEKRYLISCEEDGDETDGEDIEE